MALVFVRFLWKVRQYIEAISILAVFPPTRQSGNLCHSNTACNWMAYNHLGD